MVGSDASQSISDGGDRVVVLANPKAGAGSRYAEVQKLAALLVEERRLVVDVVDNPSAMADSANRYYEDGTLRTVVAAGGDGTVQLVANLTEPGVPITVLPMGTENLLAKHLQLPFDLPSVGDSIEHGQVISIDAGKIGDRLFLIMLSCGFDADVVRRLHGARRGNISHLSYAKPIFQSMLNYGFPELRVYCRIPGSDDVDGEIEKEIATHWAFVFNLPIYASGLGIMPEADGCDGLLDVCTFRGGSFWHGLCHVAAVSLGRHRKRKSCVTMRAHYVRIESETTDVPYQLDGDAGGYLPVEVQLIPRRVAIVGPKSL